MKCVCVCVVPAGGQRTVDGGPLGFGDVVEWIAVAVANHHLDGQQLVVSWAVTCVDTFIIIIIRKIPAPITI